MTAARALVPIDRVHPHPDNIRDELHEIDQMVELIRAAGILQDLIVTPDHAGRLIVLDGHRRLEAARRLGPVLGSRHRPPRTPGAHRMTTVTITHTPQDGTLIDGAAKGDGTADILNSAGWRFSRNLGGWYVPRSRDSAPRWPLIDVTRHQLQQAGFDVDVEVDYHQRDAEQVETDRLARMQDRAAAMIGQAERAHARAAGAEQRLAHADSRLPGNGQPILVGHHSENRHRRAIERAQTALSASVDADHAAAEAARRADVAGAAVDSRYNPVTVVNRVERIAAELRRLGRELARPGLPATARPHLEEQVAVLEQEHALWTRVHAEQVARGEVTDYGPHNVAAGDLVRIRGHWHQVVRANKKTVTVPSSLASWTDTAPWQHVNAHRPAPTKEQHA